MIERLATVIYWLGSIGGALIVAFGLAIAVSNDHDNLATLIVCVVLGAIVWLAGRAIRYVLAGRF